MTVRMWTATDTGLVLLMAALASGCALDEGDASDPPEDMTEATAHNTLTSEELTAGWELLFDGETLDGWRGYGRPTLPDEGWAVEGGDLVVFAGGVGGDIITERHFADFELTFDFKLSPEGNSGVFYRVLEHEGLTLWQVAPEYQVLDDPAYIEMGITEKHLTGDNYDLQAAQVRPLRPVGEWNQGRILVDGAHVEHWLNGQLMVAYDLWTAEWEALVAESKFAPHPPYARATEGAIGLQDHDHEIRYRNMKIRPLPADERTPAP